MGGGWGWCGGGGGLGVGGGWGGPAGEGADGGMDGERLCGQPVASFQCTCWPLRYSTPPRMPSDRPPRSHSQDYNARTHLSTHPLPRTRPLAQRRPGRSRSTGASLCQRTAAARAASRRAACGRSDAPLVHRRRALSVPMREGIEGQGSQGMRRCGGREGRSGRVAGGCLRAVVLYAPALSVVRKRQDSALKPSCVCRSERGGVSSKKFQLPFLCPTSSRRLR